MWDALTNKMQTKKESPNRIAGSINGRVRAYLIDHPHSTATQVHRALEIKQTQATCALDDLARRGHVVWALDASTLRNRQVKHYSLKD